MHRFRMLLTLMLAPLTACTTAAVTTTSVSGSFASTTSSGQTASTAATSTTQPLGVPVAWIAPSGVPAAVTEFTGGTVEILTPCGDPAELTEGTPVYAVDVVIDPGHGGPVDTGAVAPTGLTEKDINLQVGLKVQQILTERGIQAMLTRSGDYPIPISVRTTYADMVGARALVSIHHNAPVAPASDTPGTEVFVQHESPGSQRLGGLLFESVFDALNDFDVDWDRAPDAGVMTVLNSEGEDAYGMVRRPNAPSALIELGYIANQAEAELYRKPAYVSVAASAVADAVESFLTSNETGAPLTAGRIFNPRAGVGKDRCVEPDLARSLYPDVVEASANRDGATYTFEVAVSSPYDTPERYADAWRVVGDDGVVYGTRELAHDHSAEQPFTRSLTGVEIPDGVGSVTIQARDQVYGWGGAAVEVSLH